MMPSETWLGQVRPPKASSSHLHSHKLVTFLLEAGDDLPDKLSLYAVGLDGLSGG